MSESWLLSLIQNLERQHDALVGRVELLEREVRELRAKELARSRTPPDTPMTKEEFLKKVEALPSLMDVADAGNKAFRKAFVATPMHVAAEAERQKRAAEKAKKPHDKKADALHLPAQTPIGYWPDAARGGREAVEAQCDATFVGSAEWRACLWFARRPAALTSWRGMSACRVCDLRSNGSRDHFRDGMMWPEGYAHYIEAHGVRPPAAFVEAACAAYAARTEGDDELNPPRPNWDAVPSVEPLRGRSGEPVAWTMHALVDQIVDDLQREDDARLLSEVQAQVDAVAPLTPEERAEMAELERYVREVHNLYYSEVKGARLDALRARSRL